MIIVLFKVLALEMRRDFLQKVIFKFESYSSTVIGNVHGKPQSPGETLSRQEQEEIYMHVC